VPAKSKSKEWLTEALQYEYSTLYLMIE